jgi:hypothetical protein
MSTNSEETYDIKSTLYESMVLWFYPYSDTEMEMFEDDDSDEVQVGMIPDFDYEISAPDVWLVHIDFEIDFPEVARIRVRSNFEVCCIFEHLFTHDCLDLLHEQALELTIAAFNDHCTKPADEFEPLDKALYSEFLPEFSEQVIKKCLLNKENDLTFLSPNINVFTLTKSDIIRFLITGTFAIMDEILYRNEAFDLKHNRAVFHEVFPSSLYYTTRFKCLEISKGDVDLVMSQNVVFQTCMDCALQMLVGNHFETLLSSAGMRVFSEEVQSRFLKFGTSFLEGTRRELQKNGVEITNLNERYDWNKEII